jgi:hypothetical protein
MKRMLLLLAVLSFMVVVPMLGNAGIIGDVTLSESAGGPTGNVSFATYNGGAFINAYLDYNVSINGGPSLLAFCVEGMISPSGPQTYTMLSIDGGLSTFSLDPARYEAASWIAKTYGTTQREAAQIAIWEVVTDGTSGFDLTNGDFKSTSYNSEAMIILGSLQYDTSWVLLVNPTVAAGGTVEIKNYQNYITRVPEPGTLLLLGSGLLGLALAGSRKKFRK